MFSKNKDIKPASILSRKDPGGFHKLTLGFYLQRRALFPQVKLPQNLFVFLDVFLLEITQEPAAPSYQGKKAAARMEVFFMALEMLSQRVDPLG
jgi:hypothetical protein